MSDHRDETTICKRCQYLNTCSQTSCEICQTPFYDSRAESNIMNTINNDNNNGMQGNVDEETKSIQTALVLLKEIQTVLEHYPKLCASTMPESGQILLMSQFIRMVEVLNGRVSMAYKFTMDDETPSQVCSDSGFAMTQGFGVPGIEVSDDINTACHLIHKPAMKHRGTEAILHGIPEHYHLQNKKNHTVKIPFVWIVLTIDSDFTTTEDIFFNARSRVKKYSDKSLVLPLVHFDAAHKDDELVGALFYDIRKSTGEFFGK